MSGLRGKVVIITGASSGIGAAAAVEFAKVGARLVLTARRKEKLEETARSCEKTGLSKDKILTIVGDITKKQLVEQVVKSSVDKYGGIDILVNNAGQGHMGNLTTSSEDDLDRMYAIHVRAVFMLTKLAMPYILARKGNVVNVSSVVSLRVLPYMLSYTVAKGAQDQLTKTIALEFGPMGVRVNSVCPGTIKTELITNLGFEDDGKREEAYAAIGSVHPLKRMGQAEEVAKTIVFLASDDASFISGVTMPVDGARHITSWQLPSKI